MSKTEVAEASQRFYAALTRLINGDVSPMSSVWSHDDEATVMHPIGGRQVGWGDIRTSWEQVANLATEGQIDLSGQMIHVMGEVALETGVEQGRSRLAGRDLVFENRVTNVYRREASGWKLLHHHADVSPAMVRVVEESEVAAS